MNNLYNKKNHTYHKIDVIEKYGDVEVVFTEDSKCFPINETLILGADRFCELIDNVVNKTISENEKEELDIHMGRVKLVQFKNPIPLTIEEQKKEIDNFLEKYRNKNRSTKEYLLSPLSNLWSILAHPWTSKG